MAQKDEETTENERKEDADEDDTVTGTFPVNRAKIGTIGAPQHERGGSQASSKGRSEERRRWRVCRAADQPRTLSLRRERRESKVVLLTVRRSGRHDGIARTRNRKDAVLGTRNR